MNKKSLMPGGIAMILCCTSVDAAVILNEANYEGSLAVFAYGPVGQSFTAEDAALGKIAFKFTSYAENPAGNGNVTMTLYDGNGFGGSVLASVTQDISSTIDGLAGYDESVFIDFDFSGTSLVVGQIYTAAVTLPDVGPDYRIALQFGSNSYAGGQMFYTSSGSNLSDCYPSSNCDLFFRVTPVPVPAAVWLFGSGLAGLLAMSRRKQAV